MHSTNLFLASLCLLLSCLLVQSSGPTQLNSTATDGTISTSDVFARRGRNQAGGCNFFQGKWVYDRSFPMYESSSCPFNDPEFDCQKYGRPDKLYLKYAWQPDSCTLPRLNGVEMLSRWRGKKIMLVGDSLSLNQWISLACLIHASVPNAIVSRRDPLSSVTFQDYDVTIYFYRSTLLVNVERGSSGRILNLNSIEEGSQHWLGMDVLVFNSWHWWLHTGSSQPWDVIQDGSTITKDMDRLVAFSKGMTTWSKWVDQNVDTSKTKVYFLGISPTHYRGKEWSSGGRDCSGEQQPVAGSTYPAGSLPALDAIKKVLSQMQKPVKLLDITTLSQLRKDAHPGAYSGGHPGTDCSHWCVAGLPDVWNQIFYASYTGA